jgi:DNA-binding NtrC family response regulator
LESLPWPGNVRELKSAIAYAAIRADAMGQCELGPEHLPVSATYLTAPQRVSPQTGDYQKHLAHSELALIESAIDSFRTTKKADLARMLGYNDRFVFMRRIRKCLDVYPALRLEFPRTAEIAYIKGKET